MSALQIFIKDTQCLCWWSNSCMNKWAWERRHVCEEVTGFVGGYGVTVRTAGIERVELGGARLIDILRSCRGLKFFRSVCELHKSGSGHWLLCLVCWPCEVWIFSLLVALNELSTSAFLCLQTVSSTFPSFSWTHFSASFFVWGSFPSTS